MKVCISKNAALAKNRISQTSSRKNTNEKTTEFNQKNNFGIYSPDMKMFVSFKGIDGKTREKILIKHENRKYEYAAGTLYAALTCDDLELFKTLMSDLNFFCKRTPKKLKELWLNDKNNGFPALYLLFCNNPEVVNEGIEDLNSLLDGDIKELQKAWTARDYTQKTPLHRISHNEDSKKIKTAFVKFRETFKDEPEIVKEILSTQSNTGETPLHNAFEWDNLNPEAAAIVTKEFKCLFKENRENLKELLLICNNDGKIPLHLAVENKNAEAVKAAIDIYNYAFQDDAETLKKIWTTPSSYNIFAYKNARTPLHLIAHNTNPEAIKKVQEVLNTLYENDSDGLKNAWLTEDKYKTIPLHCAMKNKNTEAAKAMIDVYFSVFNDDITGLREVLRKQDIYNKTPLDFAKENKNPEILQLITRII